ncbi:MAG: isocitrate/isopropylmalate family dehydrogenase, partial [Anaerolineae bacterium]
MTGSAASNPPSPTIRRIALIPGDGIGVDVVNEGRRVLEEVARRDGGFTFEFETFPWSTDYYLRNGEMMPADGLQQLSHFDAIYLGAVGDPRLPDHVTLRGLLLPIRQGFDQYVNLRPIRLLQGVSTPLAGRTPADIDMLYVRENSEGEYAGQGGCLFPGKPQEVALQKAVFSRRGVERVVR